MNSAGKKDKLLIIGNGMGSVRLLEKLVAGPEQPYHITVLSEESCPAYNRVQLSRLLAGELALNNIELKPEQWYRDHDIRLLMGHGCRVVAIDRNKKQAKTADSQVYDYDKVVIATGSTPFRLPVPGADLDGVLTFRTLADVDRMLSACSQPNSRAIVVGGGLLGLECAVGLARQGMHVTVIHNTSSILDRQLDNTAAGLLQNRMNALGVNFRCNVSLESFSGCKGKVTAAVLAGGEVLPVDLVVVTAGVSPNIELMKQAGFDCDRGVLVNGYMQTSDPDVLAIGECIQLENETFGLVAPVYQQAEVAATVLTSQSDVKNLHTFVSNASAVQLKVSGVDLFSCGDFIGKDSDERLVLDAAIDGIYRKLVVRNNRVIGILLYGNTSDGLWYQELMDTNKNIEPIRNNLVFGREYCTA